ncbi:hypothetical protein SUDANB95_03306 [Actinosynnema sp. ALI-1.44]
MNKWVRRIHRWVSMAFTLTVLATVVALAQAEPLVWVSYLPLFPLSVLFFTGLYLFALPHVAKRRAHRRTA